ncbi:MAG: acyl-[acyl-carrier-protein]--UDP-N-acetylglucosamine O-acyltransferase [Verrucomicrobiales bacterium]|nr:acyl-[acyl-carrier-protein]--UDP-N-acetylglucosamine O-acyltransferase [Verrucomicrobiales bacterium]
MSIHPSAVIADSAQIGENVSVGPFVVIEEEVIIGDGCVLDAAAQLRRGTTLGSENHIGSGAIIGADPQVIGFDSNINGGVKIGNKNVLREYVTIHRSTSDGEFTVLGSSNYLMTGTHFGHDCIVGDNNTMANNVLLAGHVLMGNNCFVGGASVFHQFVRVADYVMVQGLSGFSLDLPPYVMAAGVNYVAGINSVGLRRAGFDGNARKEIKEAFRMVYRSGKGLKEALEEAGNREWTNEAGAFFDFLHQKSKKGFCIRMEKAKAD